MPEENECILGIRKVENALRDMMNWIAVFAEEYEIPKEAVDKLNEKVHEIAKIAGDIPCGE